MKASIRLRMTEKPVRYDFFGLLKLARAVREYAPEEKKRKKCRVTKKTC